MTTAALRNAAQDAEARLDWKTAEKLWRDAVAAYPPHNPASQLAIADKAAMLLRAQSCAYSAEHARNLNGAWNIRKERG